MRTCVTQAHVSRDEYECADRDAHGHRTAQTVIRMHLAYEHHHVLSRLVSSGQVRTRTRTRTRRALVSGSGCAAPFLACLRSLASPVVYSISSLGAQQDKVLLRQQQYPGSERSDISRSAMAESGGDVAVYTLKCVDQHQISARSSTLQSSMENLKRCSYIPPRETRVRLLHLVELPNILDLM